MTINKVTLLLFLLLAGTFCKAQLNFEFIEGKFFIKGRVIDMQSKEPVQSANIRISNTNRGTTCDDDGYFSLVVSKKDTLKITCTGYISKNIAMADIDSSKYHTLEIELLRDFIKLKDIVIYPFNGVDEFRKAFMDAKNVGKLILPGIPEPTFSGVSPKARFYNPVSFLYEKLRRRSVADPNFKP